ncbi:MAG: hypothetical protein ACK5O6_01765 [Betaproteobacteria bacterium]
MKLVTFQMLGTHELRTGIWLSKYEVIDVAAEAAARQSPLNLTTMLDIIDGGAATLALLAEISSAPKTTPILLNSALLKAPIPRPRKNVFCVGWNYLDHFPKVPRRCKTLASCRIGRYFSQRHQRR